MIYPGLAKIAKQMAASGRIIRGISSLIYRKGEKKNLLLFFIYTNSRFCTETGSNNNLFISSSSTTFFRNQTTEKNPRQVLIQNLLSHLKKSSHL
jgi:hypothetical protein